MIFGGQTEQKAAVGPIANANSCISINALSSHFYILNEPSPSWAPLSTPRQRSSEAAALLLAAVAAEWPQPRLVSRHQVPASLKSAFVAAMAMIINRERSQRSDSKSLGPSCANAIYAPISTHPLLAQVGSCSLPSSARLGPDGRMDLARGGSGREGHFSQCWRAGGASGTQHISLSRSRLVSRKLLRAVGPRSLACFLFRATALFRGVQVCILLLVGRDVGFSLK